MASASQSRIRSRWRGGGTRWLPAQHHDAAEKDEREGDGEPADAADEEAQSAVEEGRDEAGFALRSPDQNDAEDEEAKADDLIAEATARVFGRQGDEPSGGPRDAGFP